MPSLLASWRMTAVTLARARKGAPHHDSREEDRSSMGVGVGCHRRFASMNHLCHDNIAARPSTLTHGSDPWGIQRSAGDLGNRRMDPDHHDATERPEQEPWYWI